MNLREYQEKLKEIIDALESLRLPAFLDGVPRIFLVLAVPFVVFLVMVGISFGTSGGNQSASAPPTLAVAVSNTQTLPTPAPRTPTPVSAENRKDCDKIRGTAYLSDDEAKWYRDNCTGAAASRAATGSSGTTSQVQSVTGPPAAPSSGQAPSGARLVIPAAGINADVWITRVSANIGSLPDPLGYFNVLEYDTRDIPGFGGNVSGGNMLISGHVDCARCHGGAAGLAVLWHARELRPGDQAQYYGADGKLTNYVVTGSRAVGPETSWSAIFSAGAADMTIVTCTGTFNAATHEYDQRHVITLRKEGPAA